MAKTTSEITEIIEGYKTELIKLGIRPSKIVLYGSYAKGVARDDSDIDLIVVS